MLHVYHCTNQHNVHNLLQMSWVAMMELLLHRISVWTLEIDLLSKQLLRHLSLGLSLWINECHWYDSNNYHYCLFYIFKETSLWVKMEFSLSPPLPWLMLLDVPNWLDLFIFRMLRIWQCFKHLVFKGNLMMCHTKQQMDALNRPSSKNFLNHIFLEIHVTIHSFFISSG